MTNDRALLELAAKAAGIDAKYSEQYKQCFVDCDVIDSFFVWNPLTDDGDALRLAVKLGMMLDDVTKGYMSGHIVAVSDGGTCYEPREPDPYAATRRAIVRAAAEIGRTM